jgi:PAS domain S-box-containing protein
VNHRRGRIWATGPASKCSGLPPAGEAALERAERLANLLTLSYEPMLTWRLDGPIEFWNAGAERLYGFAHAEAVGRTSHALLRTEFPIDFAHLRSQLKDGRNWLGELRHICKDGRKVVVESRMQLFSDNLVLEANRDITKRIEMEVALRESEQRLRWIGAVVETSDDAIVSKNLDGIITSWNKGAERLFNYTADEAIGQPITMIIPQDRLDEERVILARIKRGERIDHFETVRRRKHGTLISISLTVSPVKNAEGKTVGASKIARDITEQKRNQEHISVLAREAEHRSKNVLSNVQAIVNLSQSDTPEGLKSVIGGRIRAMSNVHSLFAETRWTGAELSAIATQELAPYLDEQGARVRMEGPETLLKPDVAQAVAVILHELATNASKYGALSGPKGQIKLTWSRTEDGQLTLRWTELAGPRVTVPEREGFGSRLIQQTISQLGGKARFDWSSEGLVCEIALQA